MYGYATPFFISSFLCFLGLKGIKIWLQMLNKLNSACFEAKNASLVVKYGCEEIAV